MCNTSVGLDSFSRPILLLLLNHVSSRSPVSGLLSLIPGITSILDDDTTQMVTVRAKTTEVGRPEITSGGHYSFISYLHYER